MDLTLPDYMFPGTAEAAAPVPVLQQQAAVDTDLQLPDDVEIVVLGHNSKPAISIETLGDLGLPYSVYDNKDWEFPPQHVELAMDRSARPELRGYALRQFRAWKGHQEICRGSNKPYTLVFEDDMNLAAGVTRDVVLQHVIAARDMIADGYDAVSFHGRQLTPAEFFVSIHGKEYVELSSQVQEGQGHRYFLHPVTRGFQGKYENYEFKWHEGCLAYLIGPVGRKIWSEASHSGMPCDLFLVNELNTLVMRNSIFLHDVRHGSIIANTGTVAKQLTPDGTSEVQ